MSIALKYTTLKDANIPLPNFRAEKKRSAFRGHGKAIAIASAVAVAVALPLVFMYALITPHGKQTAFLEQYASSPIPTTSIPNDYLVAPTP